MKLRITFAFASLVFALAAHAEKIALINGTMINPANNQILPDATVLIDGDRIVSEVAPPDS